MWLVAIVPNSAAVRKERVMRPKSSADKDPKEF
jgi:hypothetical protein